MKVFQRFTLTGLAIVVAVVAMTSGRGGSSAETAPTQDVVGLDRRISMLEQRFYRLEQSISRLEQYATSQRSTGSSSDVRDREVDQLRQELQRVQLRLNEVECGLLKLDERTANATGNRRSGDARAADPCRQNPGLPLRLPSRP